MTDDQNKFICPACGRLRVEWVETGQCWTCIPSFVPTIGGCGWTTWGIPTSASDRRKLAQLMIANLTLGVE